MHRRMTILTAAIIFLSQTAGAALAQELVAADGTAEHCFTIRMPVGATKKLGSVEVPGGTVRTGSWSSTVEGTVYAISFADYPGPVVESRPPQQFLDEAVEGLRNQLQGAVAERREIQLAAGIPGVGYRVTSQAGDAEARNYMVGNRLYTLLVLYDPRVGSGDGDLFLGSLRHTSQGCRIGE